LRIAIAYDWQIVTELPRQAHDVPVSRVVTDTQVIEFESD
jgi:5-formyltetrahydrofolate cyclo-ligase